MSRWAVGRSALSVLGRTPTLSTNTVDTVELANGDGRQSVNSVNSVSHPVNGSGELGAHPFEPGRSPDPPTPPTGDPAELSDRHHAELARPVSWSDPGMVPSVGWWCRNCRGRQWWCEATEPKGWCCTTCHPGTHLPPGERREVGT